MAIDCDTRASDLAQLENSCLRAIYDDHGAEACAAAASHLLQTTSALYGIVAGPEKLAQLFALIQSSQAGLLS